MNVQEQIKEYIDSQSEPKRGEMQKLHLLILKWMPKCKLWFLDGTDSKGKVVTYPNVGFGSYHIKYKDGSKREFYQVGFSGIPTGISVIIMGIKDKKFLTETYSKKIGKAGFTGYSIKFNSLKDININVLEEAIRYRVETYNENE